MSSTPGNETTDEELMRAWQAGNADAFEKLYRRHRSALYRYVQRQCRDRASGDDIFQETWTTFIRQRERWQAGAPLLSFLYRIAHSRLVDHFRAEARRNGTIAHTLDDGEFPEPADDCACWRPENAAERESEARAMQRCLQELPVTQRDAFLLKEESGMSLAEMSAATGVDAEALKSRVRYALKRLRDCLQRVLGGDAPLTEVSP